MKKILIGLMGMIGVLILFTAAKTLTYSWKKQIQVLPVEPVRVDEEAIAKHLAEAIRFRTISHQDSADTESKKFLAFHDWLQRTYPAAHRTLRREIVNLHSLLYTWEGSDPALEPVIFLAHMDVVPVAVREEARWTHPPFDGVISDGFVWGRGALDMKGTLVAIMEAVEIYAAAGHQPKRTLLLGFGHDEEVMGSNGAAKIAELLKSRGVRLQWVIDEGGAITQGVISGTDVPIAVVGLAEKGYLTLEVIVEDESCHTSMPPYDTAVTRLARAITKLQQNPVPGGIEGPVIEMFDAIGPELPFMNRAAIANLWLFGPLIERELSKNPATNALLRTTAVVTMLEASPKENVCPNRGEGMG